MTREEAIRLIQAHMIAHNIGVYPHIRLAEALDMAISALQQQDSCCKKCNDPLTLDELRKMYDGEEGAVWVKNGRSCFPAILDIYGGELVAVWSAEPDCFEERHYGKAWLAYRQKPEEGTV